MSLFTSLKLYRSLYLIYIVPYYIPLLHAFIKINTVAKHGNTESLMKTKLNTSIFHSMYHIGTHPPACECGNLLIIKSVDSTKFSPLVFSSFLRTFRTIGHPLPVTPRHRGRISRWEKGGGRRTRKTAGANTDMFELVPHAQPFH